MMRTHRQDSPHSETDRDNMDDHMVNVIPQSDVDMRSQRELNKHSIQAGVHRKFTYEISSMVNKRNKL